MNEDTFFIHPEKPFINTVDIRLDESEMLLSQMNVLCHNPGVLVLPKDYVAG